MDKVIIDGIDVSECVCFATAQGVATVNGILVKDIDNACTVKQKPCEDIKNCMFKKHYKQLQRLKSENEQLKTKIFRFESKQDSMCEQNKELIEDNLNLSKENERLKEELRTEKIYSSQIEELEGSLQHAKAENEELSESIKRLKNMAKAAALGREKYKQALQEIKTIAEEWMTDYCYLDSFYEKEGCCICHENKDCYSYRLLKALTKTEEENE